MGAKMVEFNGWDMPVEYPASIGCGIVNEHIAVRSDGIYRTSFNGIQVDRPVKILPLPAKAGDRWTVEAKVGTDTIKGEMRTTEETVQILSGLKSRLEEHHGVVYTNDAIRAAVELSSKHLNDRFLPDKAIDLIEFRSCNLGRNRLSLDRFRQLFGAAKVGAPG